jgi:hypothetical protein
LFAAAARRVWAALMPERAMPEIGLMPGISAASAPT